MTEVTVSEEVVSITDEVVETILVTVGEQGPPGATGSPGFSTSVDVITGGAPNTDYTTGFIFEGGTP